MLVSRTGLFWTRDNDRECLVQVEGGDSESVDDLLTPYEGKMVHVVIRHLPEEPLQTDSWGGGCCRWEPAECPFGHHLHPNKLYADASKGVLSRENHTWKVGSSALRFDWMAGHHGQFILFSPKPVDAGDITDMVQSLSGLKAVLESLQTETE